MKGAYKGPRFHAGQDIGEALELIDIGGGVAGLPALDGSNLTGTGSGMTIEEEDGLPSVLEPTKILVPNGSLTDNGDGTASLSIGGSCFPSGPNLDSFSDNLVASWDCDEASGNLLDAQANSYDLAVGGAPTYAFADGKRGTYVKGSSTGYWANSDIPLPSTGDFAVNYWIRWIGGGGYAGVFFTPDETVTTNQIGIHFFGANIYLIGDSAGVITSVNALVTNQWHMITFARESGEWKVYVDAVLKIGNTTQGTKDLSTYKFVLGRDGSTYANGVGFDGITHYDTMLSAEAITELYQHSTARMVGDTSVEFADGADLILANPSMVANFKMEDTGSPLTSSHYKPFELNALTGSPTYENTGKDGSSIQLDTITEFFMNGEHLLQKITTGDISFGMWIKGTGTELGRWFCINPNETSVSQLIGVSCVIGSGLELNGNSDVTLILGGTNVTADTWHHIGMARDSGTWRLYLDGVEQGSTTTQGGNNISTYDLLVGYFGSINSVGGEIDEFTIWDGFIGSDAYVQAWNSGTGRFTTAA